MILAFPNIHFGRILVYDRYTEEEGFGLKFKTFMNFEQPGHQGPTILLGDFRIMGLGFHLTDIDGLGVFYGFEDFFEVEELFGLEMFWKLVFMKNIFFIGEGLLYWSFSGES